MRAEQFSAEKLGTFKDECSFRATTGGSFPRDISRVALCSSSRRRLPADVFITWGTECIPQPVSAPRESRARQEVQFDVWLVGPGKFAPRKDVVDPLLLR